MSALNKLLHKVHFKMEIIAQITKHIAGNKYAASIELQNAYFHPKSRKYLRGVIPVKILRFRALPMGLNTSVRDVSQTPAIIRQLMYQEGIFLFQYLEDWSIMAKIEA